MKLIRQALAALAEGEQVVVGANGPLRAGEPVRRTVASSLS